MQIQKTDKNSSGTSFHRITFEASPTDLVDAFGPPTYCCNDGSDKTNMEWVLLTSTGDVVTVYDWKYYSPLEASQQVIWHIGGMSEQKTRNAKKEILEVLGFAVSSK